MILQKFVYDYSSKTFVILNTTEEDDEEHS